MGETPTPSVNIEWEPDPNIFIFNNEVPGKTKMHVHSLDLDDWVKIDSSYPAQMKLRGQFLAERKDEVFVSNTDESAEACKWEFFQILVEYLPRRFPDIFDDSVPGKIYNKVLDEWVSTLRHDEEEDMLIRAGRLTQEDWCIMEYSEEAGGYILTSGIVYFPMRWSLKEKFNKVMGAIHKPVKVFTKHIQPSVYRIFLQMKPEKPIWRANWALFNDLAGPMDLYAPSASVDRNDVNTNTPYDENTGRALVFRAEYQTLRKLPETKCIVFSIRTYQRYLEDFNNVPSSDCAGLIRAIRTMDEDEKVYKSAPFWADAACLYLQNIIDKREEGKRVSAASWTGIMVAVSATALLAASLGFAIARMK